MEGGMCAEARRSTADMWADAFIRAAASTAAITTITDTGRVSASDSALARTRHIMVPPTDTRITTRIITIRTTLRPGIIPRRSWFPGLSLLRESWWAATGATSADSRPAGFEERR